MSIQDGEHELQKISLEYGNRVFKFAVNPENYRFQRPHRTTSVKTKSRIVLQDFQSDIPVIKISGTTGFNPTGRKKDQGLNKIKELKKFLEDFGEQGGNGAQPDNDFYFMNHTNEEYYVVSMSPEGVSYSQSAESPLLFNYELNFVVIREAGDPREEDVADPEIGNRIPSIKSNSGGNISPNTGRRPSVSDITGGYGSIEEHPRNGGLSEGSSGSGDIESSVGETGPGAGSTDGEGNGSVGFNPSSGSNNIYNKTTQASPRVRKRYNSVNPQAPSPESSIHGRNGLSNIIGYRN